MGNRKNCRLTKDFQYCINSNFYQKILKQTKGGNGNVDKEKFWTNPQFLIQLDGNESNNEGKVDIIISLMQADARVKRLAVKDKVKQAFIQFRIYKVKYFLIMFRFFFFI